MQTSGTPHAAQTMPRGPLIAVGALALCAVLGAGLVRLSGETIRAPDAPVAAERALRFEDRSDGSIAVIDAASGRVVDTVSGQAGFVRGTLRGLARERKRQGADPAVPFRLTGWADGRLTLEDPTTGRRIGLEAFGATNAAAFARLLQVAEARR